MVRGHRCRSKPQGDASPGGGRTLGGGLLLAGALALAACASDAPPAEASGETRSETPAVSAPPPGSPFAKVKVGMDDETVEEILGNPGRQTVYQTFKAWVPFYQGGDDRRYEWRYPGEGRITFNQNRYSGDLQVIRVDYDPDGSS